MAQETDLLLSKMMLDSPSFAVETINSQIVSIERRLIELTPPGVILLPGLPSELLAKYKMHHPSNKMDILVFVSVLLSPFVVIFLLAMFR